MKSVPVWELTIERTTSQFEGRKWYHRILVFCAEIKCSNWRSSSLSSSTSLSMARWQLNWNLFAWNFCHPLWLSHFRCSRWFHTSHYTLALLTCLLMQLRWKLKWNLNSLAEHRMEQKKRVEIEMEIFLHCSGTSGSWKFKEEGKNELNFNLFHSFYDIREREKF